MIPIASPDLSGKESEYVNECLTSTWISSVGHFISDFEQAFARLCRHQARHRHEQRHHRAAPRAGGASGIGAGDEVIVPDADLHRDRQRGALLRRDAGVRRRRARHHEPRPGRHRAPRSPPRTKGDHAGAPLRPPGRHGRDHGDRRASTTCRWSRTRPRRTARAYDGRAGRRRSATSRVFSFFGNKIITTGEGGMVTTDDDELAARLRLLRGQGMDSTSATGSPVVGYNYRMTNIAAAIGAGPARADRQVRRAPARDRGGVRADLGGVAGITLPIAATRRAAGRLAVHRRHRRVHVRPAQHPDRLSCADGIETRPVFYPLHLMPRTTWTADRRFRSPRGWARKASRCRRTCCSPTTT